MVNTVPTRAVVAKKSRRLKAWRCRAGDPVACLFFSIPTLFCSIVHAGMPVADRPTSSRTCRWVHEWLGSRPAVCPLWVISGHLQCKTACPLYPQKRTLRGSVGMSAKCQKRTLAPVQAMSALARKADIGLCPDHTYFGSKVGLCVRKMPS